MIRRAHCPDTDSLVSFLYDEFDGSEAFDRRAIARHLDEGCDRCAAEVTSLGGVRQTLKEWAAPEMALGFRVVNDPPRRSWGASWLPAWSMPALPLAAAAVWCSARRSASRGSTCNTTPTACACAPAGATRPASDPGRGTPAGRTGGAEQTGTGQAGPPVCDGGRASRPRVSWPRPGRRAG